MWPGYMLQAVAYTAQLTYEKINRIVAAHDVIQEVIASQTTVRHPEQLTQNFFIQPVARVRHLTEDRTYAENTARDYLNCLVELDILGRKTISGNHYYLNRELYSILAE